MTDRVEAAPDGADIRVVELSGDLDTSRCDFYFSMLMEPIDSGCTKLIINCRRLEYITSLGLGMLLRVHAKIRKRGGEVRLAAPKPAIADVFRMVRLDQVIPVYSTVEEAAESFDSV